MKKEEKRNNTTVILLVVILVLVAGYFAYTLYKENQREECARKLRSEYVNNLWLQNEIQARCNK